MSKLRTYKIPVEYKMYGYYIVKAASLEKAVEDVAGQCLPPGSEYLDDSLIVDYENIEFHTDDLTDKDRKFIEEHENRK